MLSSKKVISISVLSVLAAVIMPAFAHAETIDVSSALVLNSLLSTGADLRLSDDIVATGHLRVNAESSIDLNGHTLTLGNSVLIPFEKLTVFDSSDGQAGKITCTGNYCVQVGGSSDPGEFILNSGTIETDSARYATIYNLGDFTMNGGTIRGNVVGVYGGPKGNTSTFSSSKFTMNDGLIEMTDDGDAVVLKKGTTYRDYEGGPIFEMYGGRIDATYPGGQGAGVVGYKDAVVHIYDGEIESTNSFAIVGNGSGSESSYDGRNFKLTIDGGTIKAGMELGLAIYIPQQNGETVINGGHIEGGSGIEVRAGSLTINGGTFVGNTERFDVSDNTSGSAVTGAAVSVAQHSTKQPINVVINSGDFTAYTPLAHVNPFNHGADDLNKINIQVNGGTFQTEADDVVIAPDEGGALSIRGGIFAKAVTPFVADGYGEVPLESDAVEVTPLHNITVGSDNADDITVEKTVAPYKSSVNFTVNNREGFKKIIELVDENDEIMMLSGDSFIVPDSDVTIRVRYIELTRYKVTFRVLNGTWDDGEMEDIEIELVEDENGNVVLSEFDFPTGMIVNQGFTGGAWDAMVDGEEVIDGDKTFIFAFVEEEIGEVIGGNTGTGSGTETGTGAVDDGKTTGETEKTEEELPVPDTNKEESLKDATSDNELDIPETGANTGNVNGRISSIAGLTILAAGIVALIGGVVHVAKNMIIGDEG